MHAQAHAHTCTHMHTHTLVSFFQGHETIAGMIEANTATPSAVAQAASARASKRGRDDDDASECTWHACMRTHAYAHTHMTHASKRGREDDDAST